MSGKVCELVFQRGALPIPESNYDSRGNRPRIIVRSIDWYVNTLVWDVSDDWSRGRWKHIDGSSPTDEVISGGWSFIPGNEFEEKSMTVWNDLRERLTDSDMMFVIEFAYQAMKDPQILDTIADKMDVRNSDVVAIRDIVTTFVNAEDTVDKGGVS